MTTEIRRATAADATALAELRWEFRAGKSAPSEERGAFVDRCAAWMSAELAGSGWHAWVGVQDARIVGQIWMQVLSKIPNPNGERERHAYISNVYVMPSARGGVGTRLLAAALAWASAIGVDYVVLWPTSRSRSLYARRGFAVSDALLGLQCP
jgi:GNAT superfamily N-acetyltransferase